MVLSRKNYILRDLLIQDLNCTVSCDIYICIYISHVIIYKLYIYKVLSRKDCILRD